MVKRLFYIDKLRFFATVSVIILHCNASYFIQHDLYATGSWWFSNSLNSIIRWGVPIFFMISGKLLLTKDNDGKIGLFLKRRLKRVFIPFLFWAFIYYIDLCVTQNMEFSLTNFFRRVVEKNISYHLWFVYTLISIYFYVPLFLALEKSKKEKIIKYIFALIVVTSTIMPMLSKLLDIKCYVPEIIINGYLGLFLLGYILDSISFSAIQRKWIYLGGILGIMVFIFGTFTLSSPYQINAFFNGGYQVNTYLVAIMVFVFVKYDFSNKNQNEKIRSLYGILSKVSYGVYLIHILILKKLQLYITIEEPIISILAKSLFTIGMSYIFMLGLYYIVRKNKWLSHLLLGI